MVVGEDNQELYKVKEENNKPKDRIESLEKYQRQMQPKIEMILRHYVK